MNRKFTLYLALLALLPGATVAYITDASSDRTTVLRPVISEPRHAIAVRPFDRGAGFDHLRAGDTSPIAARGAWPHGASYPSAYLDDGCGMSPSSVSPTRHVQAPARYVM